MRCVQCPVFFVMGTTGSGKSGVAVRLAAALRDVHGYEQPVVVNCDVMQFYRDLPVATNKPCAGEMHGVPHLFVGFLSPHNTLVAVPEEAYAGHDKAAQCSASTPDAQRTFHIHDYVRRVTDFIEAHFAAQPRSAVIVCGGTNYYMQSLLCTDMLVEETPTCAASDAVSDAALWDRLHDIDASCAERYHPHDTRRLRRLLDIYATTGKLPSDVFSAHTPSLRYGPERTFVVWLHRAALGSALDARVDEMVRRGMIDEARAFWTAHGDARSSLVEAIGYKEFAAMWRGAAGTESAAIEAVKTHTRRYARQQAQWWRNRCVPLLRRAGATHVLQMTVDDKDGSDGAAAALRHFFADGDAAAACGAALPRCLSCPLADAAGESSARVKREYCEVCKVAVYGARQMEAHLHSRRHRGSVKRRQLEQAQLAMYGRVLPPRKQPRRDAS